MTHRLTSTLTALTMLAHSVLGCCSHHVHAAEFRADDAGCAHSEDKSSQTDIKPGSQKHGRYKGCSHRHAEAASEHLNDEVPATVDSRGEGCPHDDDPCHHNSCDEDECRFNKTAVTITPRPDDGGRQFLPLAPHADLGSAGSLAGIAGLEAADSPPGCWCAVRCAAPVTQVWRL